MLDSTISAVTIPLIEATADESWRACLWASQFVETAIHEAAFEFDELPEFAVRFSALWKYLSRQRNDGHAYVGENLEADVDSCRRAAEMLEHLKLAEHRALLNKVICFVVQNNDRLNEMYAEGEEEAAREPFWDFDERFSELRPAYEDLIVLLRDWLLRQPWVEIINDDAPATYERLRQSIPNHPLSEQRFAERKRRLHAENHGAILAFMKQLSKQFKRKS